jgi:hypothetical protein
MLSRLTFHHRAAAEELLAKLASDSSQVHSVTPAQILLTDACLRICRAELAGGFEASGDPIETRVYHVLREAAKARTPGKPLWAGYAEATLHLVERTLGMRVQDGGASFVLDTDRARGQACGTYSTPDFIADTMIREVVGEIACPPKRKLAILDLSMEAGQFLLTFMVHDGKHEAHFYGIDRDAVAIEVAKRLFRYARWASANQRVRLSAAHQDSLLEDLPRAWPRQFSVVIGNPPWKARHPEYTETVRERFRPVLKGNFDLYLAFFLRAHDFVQAGGLLCFTIPSTFLFNQSAMGIRKMLLDNYDILSLRMYPQRSFIEVPCLIPISILARRRTKDDRRATLISYHPVQLGGPQKPRWKARVQVAGIWSNSPGTVFHPLIRRELAFLHGQFSRQSLKDFGQLTCGARLSKVAGLRPESAFTGFHARNIRAFHACVHAAPRYQTEDALFYGSPDYHAIAAHKVVFQDLRYMTHAVRLVAAVAPPGTAAVSTASVYLPNDTASAHFYAALLNSCFANAWYKARDVNRSIKLAILGELPVACDTSAWARIAALARECARIRTMVHEAVRNGPADEERVLNHNSSLLSSWKDTRYQIDDEVFHLYALSAGERTAARKFVEARVF